MHTYLENGLLVCNGTFKNRENDQEVVNMDNRERRDLEMAYISDDSVMEEQKRCRKLMQELNTADRSDYEGIKRIIKEMLGKSEGAFINPPFYCDYGSNIEVGKSFFANYNCTIIDVAKVTIGDNWHPMSRSIRRGTRYTRYPETPSMSTA